jgi:flagellin-specific chaperone FliS
MSDEHVKTPIDHVGDTLVQLKEMRHYAKNNVEALTASWLLYDGELSKLKRAQRIADLMDRQAQLHEALEQAIADLEELQEELKPEPEAEA